MADVSAKSVTHRSAEAEVTIRLSPDTIDQIERQQLPKGDAIATAKVAAVLAVKKTPELIPLCHPVRVDKVETTIEAAEEGLVVRVLVEGSDRTGFEMEALTGAATAALTVYDMVKSIEPGASISELHLLAKSGGVHGDYRAPA